MSGGWIATSGLSWSSAFGPGALLRCGGAGERERRGGSGDEREEERVGREQDRGRPADDRVGVAVAVERPRRPWSRRVSRSAHSRIEPSSADHSPVIEYSSGVTVALFSAT